MSFWSFYSGFHGWSSGSALDGEGGGGVGSWRCFMTGSWSQLDSDCLLICADSSSGQGRESITGQRSRNRWRVTSCRARCRRRGYRISGTATGNFLELSEKGESNESCASFPLPGT